MKRLVILHAVWIALFLSCDTDAMDPAAPVKNQVVARVLGKSITLGEQDQLNGIIFGRLIEAYAKEHQIAATKEEVDAFVAKSREQKQESHKEWEQERARVLQALKEESLSKSDEEALKSKLEMYDGFLNVDSEMESFDKQHPGETRKMEEDIAKQFIYAWKLNLKLYEQYGGRVIFQQAGVEPLDAYRLFLRARQEAGDFQILDETQASSFWNYFTNDLMHTFYSKEDSDKFMKTPWWLMSPSEGDQDPITNNE